MPLTAAAEPIGSAAAEDSLRLCRHADDVADADKPSVLGQGRQLAESAVAMDARDAAAHFALFCNAGKLLELRGVSIASLIDLRGLRREFDTALELAPNDADALAAKGAMLLRLPHMPGGDPGEAKRLLRHALAVDPYNDAARLYLRTAEETLQGSGATAMQRN